MFSPALVQNRCKRRCYQCLSCTGLCSFTEAASDRSQASSALSYLADFTEWWPDGGRTPLLYFNVHHFRMKIACVKHARDSTVWRQENETPLSCLRASRGLPPLSLKVPRACTGVNSEDSKAHFSGTVQLKFTAQQSCQATHSRGSRSDSFKHADAFKPAESPMMTAYGDLLHESQATCKESKLLKGEDLVWRKQKRLRTS